jgi:predicted aspartyl protease
MPFLQDGPRMSCGRWNHRRAEKVFAAAIALVLPAAAVCRAAGSSLEIPFTFFRNQILLEAEVNGKGPFQFVLDSGTFSSTVSLRLAKELKLPLDSRPAAGIGAGNRPVRARATRIERLRLGGLTLSDFPAAALDLAAASEQFRRPLDGVLGNGFLSGRIIQIDYFHRRLRVMEESPFPPGALPASTAQRFSSPMQFVEGSVMPVLEDCYVNGVRLSLTVDTGSSLGLILFPHAIQRLGLEPLARTGLPMPAAGYGGLVRLTKGWVKSLALGKMDLGAVEVAYVRGGYRIGEGTRDRGGNLGNALLQEFVVTLDFKNRVVVIEPPAE